MFGQGLRQRKSREAGGVKQLPSETYERVIRVIREAPEEMTDQEIISQIKDVYGTTRILVQQPVDWLSYVFQVAILVSIVLLFIFTISYVSTPDTPAEEVIIVAPGTDAIFN